MHTRGYYWNVLESAMNIPELHGSNFEHKLRVMAYKARAGELTDLEVQALCFCLKELDTICKPLLDTIKID